MRLLERIKRHREGREEGATLVEFALLAPVFFMVVFGVVDAAMAFRTWVSVQHGAEMGARFAVTGKDTCTGGSTRTQCITLAARNGINTLNSYMSATITVDAYTYASNYATKVTNSAGQQCDAVEITVSYAYVPMTPIIQPFWHSATLTGKQRFINEPWDRCA